jgi:hypothetical protein
LPPATRMARTPAAPFRFEPLSTTPIVQHRSPWRRTRTADRPKSAAPIAPVALPERQTQPERADGAQERAASRRRSRGKRAGSVEMEVVHGASPRAEVVGHGGNPNRSRQGQGSRVYIPPKRRSTPWCPGAAPEPRWHRGPQRSHGQLVRSTLHGSATLRLRAAPLRARSGQRRRAPSRSRLHVHGGAVSVSAGVGGLFGRGRSRGLQGVGSSVMMTVRRIGSCEALRRELSAAREADAANTSGV